MNAVERLRDTAELVHLENVTKRFGEAKPALDTISASIRGGEITGLVGPDGAGKTTLIRLMTGLMLPDGGTVKVLGFEPRDGSAAIQASIGYMPQRFGLYEDLSVQENLDLYADLRGLPKSERAATFDELLTFTDLKRFTGRLAGKLSGGMKQKLSLCCALIHEPEVLLLDEPTFGVDPISRRDLWLIVHEMVARGMTALVSTAYLDEAERCDRVALLQQGTLAGLDTPIALQALLAGRAFAFQTDNARAAARALRGHPLIRSAAAFGEALHVTTEKENAEDALTHALMAAGIRVVLVRPLAVSLEDVFIDLTSVSHAG
jgi:ABC-2 type transport system ATP-binding protein